MIKRKGSRYYACDDVQLLHGGRELFGLIHKLIAEARKSIHLHTYIFNDDRTGMEVAHALMEAAGRGVQVFVLVDGYASQGLEKPFIADMRNAGVHFRFFQPLLKSSHF